MPCFAGKERAEESCGGRTFSSHPSVGSRLLLGQHEDPGAPKPPVPRPSPPAPGADGSKHPAEECPRLLSAPTAAAGAAGPVARPHGATRFGDRSSSSVCTVLNPVGGPGCWENRSQRVRVPVHVYSSAGLPCRATVAIWRTPIYVGFPCPEDAGLGTGRTSLGRLRALLPGP